MSIHTERSGCKNTSLFPMSEKKITLHQNFVKIAWLSDGLSRDMPSNPYQRVAYRNRTSLSRCLSFMKTIVRPSSSKTGYLSSREPARNFSFGTEMGWFETFSLLSTISALEICR